MLNRFVEYLLDIGSDKLNSVIEFNNIIGRYNEHNILTKDENFCSMLEIGGLNLSSKTNDELVSLLATRNSFFSKLDSLFSITIFSKKTKEKKHDYLKTNNVHANLIIDKWYESLEDTYEIKYYISLTTRKKDFTSYLNKFKDDVTNEKDSKNNIEYLNKKLDEMAKRLMEALQVFNPVRLNSKQVLDFYASYFNMSETKTNSKKGLLSDNYINSNLHFKKDHMIHDNGEKKYSRFVSVKAYETEYLDSNMIKDLTNLSVDIMICQQVNKLGKEKSVAILNDILRNCSELVEDEVYQMREEVKTDREHLATYSFSVLITCITLEKLNRLTRKIENIISNQYSLNTVRENINQKPLYQSFTPSRDNLNARKREFQTTHIALLNPFDKEFKGFDKSRFGEGHIVDLRTEKNSTIKFNLHDDDTKDGKGHFLAVAPTKGGKTTFISFIVAFLLKYDIDILCYDKLHGMYAFCKFLDGEYQDVNENFELNPFSLDGTEENKNFLFDFLCQMGKIKEDDHEIKTEISKAIDLLYHQKEDLGTVSLSDFIEILPPLEGLEYNFNLYQNGILDNEKCSLEFNKKLTVLGMDSILKNKDLGTLVSMYIQHKLKVNATQKGRAFLSVFDELRDFLHNKTQAHLIAEQLVEVRKIGGSIGALVQNMEFFQHLEDKDTFLTSFAKKIFFPSTEKNQIDRICNEFDLTEHEKDFLRNSPPSDRKVLIKEENHSTIVDIDLSPLGDYLKVFNSNSETVREIQKLIEDYPTDWRERFLND